MTSATKKKASTGRDPRRERTWTVAFNKGSRITFTVDPEVGQEMLSSCLSIASEPMEFPLLDEWKDLLTEDPDFNAGLRVYARSNQAQRRDFLHKVNASEELINPHPRVAAQHNGWLAGWGFALERQLGQAEQLGQQLAACGDGP